MKRRITAHPLMIFSLLKPFLFVIFLPVIKGIVQYGIFHAVSGVLNFEVTVLATVFVITFLRFRAFSVTVGEKFLTVESGVVFKRQSVIGYDRISSVSERMTPVDRIFGAVSYSLNTEAGRVGKPDFTFKISKNDAKYLSKMLYSEKDGKNVAFSAAKIAFMSAATSSAFAGLIIGVPILKRTGDLLGLALSDMLLDGIIDISERFDTYFPPAVNIITLVFIIAYAFSFAVTFLKNLRFRITFGQKSTEIRSGLLVPKCVRFENRDINDICIEQTPLMRFFGRYSMRVSIGGYGNSRGEKAVLMPCGRKMQVDSVFSKEYPFLKSDGVMLRSVRSGVNLRRFLLFPRLFAAGIIAVSAVLTVKFAYFNRLILFFAVVLLCLDLYYAGLNVFNFRSGGISLEKNVFARSTRGFLYRELFCEPERVGVVTVYRSPADRRHGTCKIKLTVRSESADSITVRLIPVESVSKRLTECFEIKGIKLF